MKAQIILYIIEIWTLIVAIATLVVTTCTYVYTRKNNKRHIKSMIAHKKAQLKSLENNYHLMGLDHTVADSTRVQKILLQAEIEQLENEL